MHLVCDVGTKNFCYILFDNEKYAGRLPCHPVIDFEIVEFDKKNLVSSVVEKMKALPFHECLIESQIFGNAACVKIQTIIETYCVINDIECTSVPAVRKFKILSIPKPTKYSDRKKIVIEYGSNVIEKYATPVIRDRVDKLQKKDDFYDCLLMAISELRPENLGIVSELVVQKLISIPNS